MADNSSLPVASGNETFANDDIGGVKYPRPKINWGPDGTANDVDVASGKPLPVQLRSPTGTDMVGTAGTSSAAVLTVQGIASGTPQPVTGTITAVTALTNALPAGTNAIGKVDVQFAGAAPDLGSGTAGTKTQRVIIDSSQFSALGQTTMSASAPVVIANNQSAFPVQIENISNGEYETVAAGQSDQVLGATGAVGDWLEGLLIVPGTAAAGAVSIKDGNGSSISVFAGGGTTALPTLAPIYVPLGLKCVNATTAGWKVTTGTNVTAIGIGNFT